MPVPFGRSASIHPSANPPPNIQVLLFVLIPLAVLLFALEPVLASRGGGGAGGPLQVAKAALTDRVSPLALFWVCLGGRCPRCVGTGWGVDVCVRVICVCEPQNELLCVGGDLLPSVVVT